MLADEKAFLAVSAGSSRISKQESFEVAVPVKLNYTLKLDLRLIPILGCTYTISFLDRTNSKPHRLIDILYQLTSCSRQC